MDQNVWGGGSAKAQALDCIFPHSQEAPPVHREEKSGAVSSPVTFIDKHSTKSIHPSTHTVLQCKTKTKNIHQH